MVISRSYKAFIIYLHLLFVISINNTFADKELKITPCYQVKTFDCWAAACKMVLEHYHINKTLNEIHEFGSNGGYDIPNALFGYPRSCDVILNHYGEIESEALLGPYPRMGVVKEIDSDRPIMVAFKYGSAPVGHVVVLIGYRNHEGTSRSRLPRR